MLKLLCGILKMKIPKKFNLIDEEISVKYDNTLLHESNAYGLANFIKKEISLYDDIPGGEYQVFLHEVIHLILDKIYYKELARDEQFVDLLSSSLHQMLITSEGDLSEVSED